MNNNVWVKASERLSEHRVAKCCRKNGHWFEAFYDKSIKMYVHYTSGTSSDRIPVELIEWLDEQIEVPVEKQITHFHVADNSNAFHDWLRQKGIEFVPNGHFTSIPLEGNDIFSIGGEFALYKQKYQQKEVPVEDKMIEIGEMWCEVVDATLKADKAGEEVGNFIPNVLEKNYNISRKQNPVPVSEDVDKDISFDNAFKAAVGNTGHFSTEHHVYKHLFEAGAAWKAKEEAKYFIQTFKSESTPPNVGEDDDVEDKRNGTLEKSIDNSDLPMQDA
jgi:hypothetical protein